MFITLEIVAKLAAATLGTHVSEMSAVIPYTCLLRRPLTLFRLSLSLCSLSSDLLNPQIAHPLWQVCSRRRFSVLWNGCRSEATS